MNGENYLGKYRLLQWTVGSAERSIKRSIDNLGKYFASTNSPPFVDLIDEYEKRIIEPEYQRRDKAKQELELYLNDVEEKLLGLDNLTKEILIARFFEDKSIKTIARETYCSRSTVHRHINKGLQHIENKLKNTS